MKLSKVENRTLSHTVLFGDLKINFLPNVLHSLSSLDPESSFCETAHGYDLHQTKMT